MINLNDIKGRSALSLLEKYEGINPYLLRLKNSYLKNNIKLTENQITYILENHDKDPLKINRIVAITPYLGEELKKQDNLSFIPERILIEFILADTEKTFHVYGKLKQNQTESKMYWLPKTQVIDDPYFEKIDVKVDFTKYNEILAKQGKKLFAHQEEGVKFLLSRKGALLGDDMGAGKTVQAIVSALESGAAKILIVCPSAVKINWEREIQMFNCYDTYIVEGRKWGEAKFTIINFDILKNFHTIIERGQKIEDLSEINRELVNAKFDLCIIDEAHNLKNKNSIRGDIMADLCVNHGIDRVWLLTGTPVANRPMDYYNLLRLIKAPIADNWKFYVKRYCEAKKFFKTLKNGRKKQIWLTNGASNLEELATKTKNYFLRRLKEDIIDLPDKIISKIHHKLSDEAWITYEGLWEDYLIKRKQAGKKGIPDKAMVELGLLRKFIAMEAVPKTINLVEDALDEDRKVVIFTTFTDELMELANYFGNKCVIHNGQMSDVDKQESIDQFQNNPKIKIFIGNIKSAGVGITLTSGSVLIFNSFDWVPGNNEQAENRIYRIGSKINVNVYYQLFENTVSFRMWKTLNIKKNIISTIIGDINNENDIITLLMDNIIKENND